MGKHLKLHHLKCQPGDLAEYALLPGDPNRTRIIAQEYLDSPRMVNEFRGLLSYTGTYAGIPISVVTTGMGSPSASIVLEELNILGVKTVIRVGTCGAVKRDIPPGRIVIPNGAVPLCGILTAYELEPLPPVPDFTVLKTLVEAATFFEIEYTVGIIGTSDAFYGEVRQAKTWEDKGVVAFEMECAGLFALGLVKGLKVGAILATTGNILYGEQVMETEVTARAIRDEIRIALEAVKLLENL
ncbi:TPA: purine-nucleoside phosphorylase [bacterium]|nr:purine-nucleoside phosphorylase [bacterium]